MTRATARFCLLFSLLASTACTQTPAQIDMKGGNSYTRSGESSASYASNYSSPTRSYSATSSHSSGYQAYKPPPVYTNTRPVSLTTEQSAPASSIGVSDLSPPPKNAAKPESKAVNHWTNKPRGEEAKALPQTIEKPIAKLDSIIENDKKPVSKPKPLAENKSAASFMWPVNDKKIVSGYGPKSGGKVNDGINIASPEGEPVWASADGEVVYTGNELKGYGNMVLIKHAGNKTTSYAHLSRATVDKYDRVKQGDIIGYVGSTGNVKQPQLHFAIRDGKDPVDPNRYLSRSVAGL